MRAIVVSGMPAVGKTTVSKILAKRLSLRVVGGGDVLKEIAVEKGFVAGGADWWDTPEGMKFLKERRKSPNFDIEVDSRLLRKVKNGNVVITSYPLPWLTKTGIKVWLSGSVESRARRMSGRDGVAVAKCKKVLGMRDSENYRLYKKIYQIKFGKDLSPFDLIVDTESIDEAQVADIILHFAKNRSD